MIYITTLKERLRGADMYGDDDPIALCSDAADCIDELEAALQTERMRTKMALIAERKECINIIDEAISRIHARGEAQREPT